jgi:tRNA modification GTPase
LAKPLAALREELLDLLAHLEAGLDFAEEDIAFISSAQLHEQLQDIARRISELQLRMHSRAEAGCRPRIVLVGLPNTGKSSLLNALSQDSAAIVSDFPGTTRDFVAKRTSFGGRECLLIDTAGLQAAHDQREPEKMAQEMTRLQAEQADLTLLCLDVSRPLTAWEREQLSLPCSAGRLVVWTKCDLPRAADVPDVSAALLTSSVAGQGLDDLRRAIIQRLAAATSEPGVVAGTADRCRESLGLASASLRRAIAAIRATGGEELVAAELRIALDELGRVVGAVFTDDILDRIFSRFCIGK